MKNELHLSRTFILTTFIVLLIAVVAVTSHRASAAPQGFGLIGDLVWHDSNANQALDGGEFGIGGVEVRLYKDNFDPTQPALDTTTTLSTPDTNGNPVGWYEFRVDQPGIYFVFVPQQNALDGYALTTVNVPLGNPIIVDQTTAFQNYFEADFGYARASVDIEKATNGQDADSAPGPAVTVDSTVNWTYVVTNNGEVALSNVGVSDDQGVSVSCPKSTLAVGESMTCTASGTATAGQYQNIGTATGQHTANGQTTTVQDQDPSHYFGGNAAISIEKATNGEDADSAPGPFIPVGSAVAWTYLVTNNGNVPLTNVSVSDDQGVTVSCPESTLAVGESMTCTASGTATAGQYQNTGTATGTPPTGGTVTDSDPSHYFGSNPSIDIEKATNGEDADSAPGPFVPVGSAVTWTYLVTNSGNVTLNNITVTDDQGVSVSCPQTSLVIGGSMTCTASGTATAGQYQNTGTATGTPPTGGTITDSDDSHYFGSNPSIDIEKATNGEDADSAPGPFIPVGSTVTWTYLVTNSGNVPLTNVSVSDDKLGAISCPESTLAVGESMTCTASGTATAGQYQNTGTATGTPPTGGTVTDSDDSHYFGSNPSIDIEKATNGEDADNAPGPFVPVGSTVTWTYLVTNNGNVTLNNITVTDDQGVSVSCPKSTLAVGESMTCTASGTATAGQYQNTGTATGTPPTGSTVTDSDDSHYFGSNPSIDIEKATNGEDADSAPGPFVPVGSTVTWTYLVTNNGNVPLTNVSVSDDKLGAVSCPESTLAVGESMTCTASGTATAGQYQNTGTATGTPPTGGTVTDSDPSHYFGSNPAIDVEKLTNGHDADNAPGPAVLIGSEVTWTYLVTNRGNVTLTQVKVVDDKIGTICEDITLLPGASTTCEIQGTAIAGQYENTATVTGTTPGGNTVTDSDLSHYFGGQPALSVTKEVLPIGAAEDGIITVANDETVTFRIRVRNTGSTTLTVVPLVDRYDSEFLGFSTATPLQSSIDQQTGTIVWNDLTGNGVLEPGQEIEVFITFLPLKSTDGEPDQQTTNTAVVSGAKDETGQTLPTVQDDDPIRITDPGIAISKTTTTPANGSVEIGEEIVFTIKITNIGDTTLEIIPLRDLYEADILRFVRTNISGAQILTSGNNGEIFWPDVTTDLGDLAPGASVEFTVTFELIKAVSTTNVARTDEVTDENGDKVSPVEGTSGAEVIPAQPPSFSLFAPFVSNPAPGPTPTPTLTPTPTPSPTPSPTPELPIGGGQDEPCPPGGCVVADLFHPKGIAVHTGLNVLFITSRDNNQLLKLDLGTNQVLATAATGSEPWDVVVDETKNEVYVSNYASNSVWVYDANTMAVKQQISTADKPALMDYLPKLNALAVVVRGINGVAIIDTVSYKVMQYLGVGGKGVYGIAADPVNNHLVVTNRDTGNSRVLYWESNNWFKGGELKFGNRASPFEAAYNPANNKLYIAYVLPNARWYIDVFEKLNPNSVPKLATIEVGAGGHMGDPNVGGTGLAVNPVTGNVWHANTFDNTVSVISGTTDQVIQTINTGVDPYEIAIHHVSGTVYVTLRNQNAIEKIPDLY